MDLFASQGIIVFQPRRSHPAIRRRHIWMEGLTLYRNKEKVHGTAPNKTMIILPPRWLCFWFTRIHSFFHFPLLCCPSPWLGLFRIRNSAVTAPTNTIRTTATSAILHAPPHSIPTPPTTFSVPCSPFSFPPIVIVLSAFLAGCCSHHTLPLFFHPLVLFFCEVSCCPALTYSLSTIPTLTSPVSAGKEQPDFDSQHPERNGKREREKLDRDTIPIQPDNRHQHFSPPASSSFVRNDLYSSACRTQRVVSAFLSCSPVLFAHSSRLPTGRSLRWFFTSFEPSVGGSRSCWGNSTFGTGKTGTRPPFLCGLSHLKQGRVK
ncbi:hypothetical protein B0T20DRAFT_54223 [Sordaria brevicollis]|uniref:Uncharacterized protein n=1 Tax=Sordaria brevicollis TaxID=83679 RepID=A0AAE0U6F6_SORBR|nr:hypothetical protein B0T20DRAFT_54223 [Sordaria brevicollis]